MEISDNTNSVTLDIDKLSFKKDGDDNFVMNLEPGKETVSTNINVFKSNTPFEMENIYLTGLTEPNKSILTKFQAIDNRFGALDISLIYLNNVASSGGGGGSNTGGSTGNGIATTLQFGSTQVNLPSILGSNGQTLIYNSSTGTFGWGTGSGGSSSTNILTFGSVSLNLPSYLGSNGQAIVYNNGQLQWGSGSSSSNILTFGATTLSLPSNVGLNGQVIIYNNGQLEWADRTTSSGGSGSGVSSTDFNNFTNKVDVSFQDVYADISRIDASINDRIDVSLAEIKASVSNATNTNYYATSILDNSFTTLSTLVNDVSSDVVDISSTLETFRTTANQNFTTIINELATTSDKFDDNNARFLSVNSNFNAFDDIITDICDNHLKKLIDNSNALLIGNNYLTLPTSQPGDNQVLKYINNQIIWANVSSTSSSSATEIGVTITFDHDATEDSAATFSGLAVDFSNGVYDMVENSSGSSNTFKATFESVGPNEDMCNNTLLKLAQTTAINPAGPPQLTIAKVNSNNKLYIFPHINSGNYDENTSYVVTSFNIVAQGGGATAQEVTDHMTRTDASFVIVDTSFDTVEASFVVVDTSFTSVQNTFNNFDNVLTSHDASFGNYIKPSIISLQTEQTTQTTNHNNLTNTVNNHTNLISTNQTNIQTLFTRNDNRVNEINALTGRVDIIDLSLGEIDTSLNNIDNKIESNRVERIYIDLSINRIDQSLNTLKTDITNINNDITDISNDITNHVDVSLDTISSQVNQVSATTSSIQTSVNNLLNKKTNILDFESGGVPLPQYPQSNKALVTNNDGTSFQWASVNEITKESDVNLLNLNVYGSSDVSGNIRVADEIVVGMVDGNESIHNQGVIKTNALTLHNLTFPTVPVGQKSNSQIISEEKLYHDISGIHITKSYLHNADISGVVKPLETSSIVTPSGVTIKFL